VFFKNWFEIILEWNKYLWTS